MHNEWGKQRIPGCGRSATEPPCPHGERARSGDRPERGGMFSSAVAPRPAWASALKMHNAWGKQRIPCCGRSATEPPRSMLQRARSGDRPERGGMFSSAVAPCPAWASALSLSKGRGKCFLCSIGTSQHGEGPFEKRPGSRSNTLQVEQDGALISLWVNDVFLETVTDTPFAGGYLGLANWAPDYAPATSVFDDFRVTAWEEPALYAVNGIQPGPEAQAALGRLDGQTGPRPTRSRILRFSTRGARDG